MAVGGVNQKKPVGTVTPGNPPSATGGGRPADDHPGLGGPTPAPPAPPAPPPVPTDPRGFQTYLNQHGANPPLVVDGVVGPKTLAAAQRLGVAVPANLAPASPQAPQQSAPAPAAAPPAVSVAGAAAPAPATAVMDDETLAQQFGYGTWVLDIPELRSVIDQYAQAQQSGTPWTPGQLQTAIENTNYWKTHDQNQRDFDKAVADGEAQPKIDAQATSITQTAKQLGVNIDPNRLQQMATDAVRNGWSQDQLNQAIAAEFHYQPGQQTGKIGEAENQIRQWAQNYLMPVSDATMAQWDQQVASGVDPASFQQAFINYAKSRYPTVAPLLDQGQTLRDIAQPYGQTAASTLGINADSIDWSDPKWSRVFQGQQQAGVNAGFQMFSDYDWQKLLKTDPTYGWQTSEPGKQSANQFALALLQGLGRAA